MHTSSGSLGEMESAAGRETGYFASAPSRRCFCLWKLGGGGRFCSEESINKSIGVCVSLGSMAFRMMRPGNGPELS